MPKRCLYLIIHFDSVKVDKYSKKKFNREEKKKENFGISVELGGGGVD